MLGFLALLLFAVLFVTLAAHAFAPQGIGLDTETVEMLLFIDGLLLSTWALRKQVDRVAYAYWKIWAAIFTLSLTWLIGFVLQLGSLGSEKAFIPLVLFSAYAWWIIEKSDPLTFNATWTIWPTLSFALLCSMLAFIR